MDTQWTHANLTRALCCSLLEHLCSERHLNRQECETMPRSQNRHCPFHARLLAKNTNLRRSMDKILHHLRDMQERVHEACIAPLAPGFNVGTNWVVQDFVHCNLRSRSVCRPFNIKFGSARVALWSPQSGAGICPSTVGIWVL